MSWWSGVMTAIGFCSWKSELLGVKCRPCGWWGWTLSLCFLVPCGRRGSEEDVPRRYLQLCLHAPTDGGRDPRGHERGMSGGVGSSLSLSLLKPGPLSALWGPLI